MSRTFSTASIDRNRQGLLPYAFDCILWELLTTPVFVYPTEPSELSEKEDAAVFANPVILFGNAASAQVFFGGEWATPQAFCIGKAVLSASAACRRRTGYQTRSLQTQPVARTVRCGEPTGGGVAGLQHASRPNSWLSAWGDGVGGSTRPAEGQGSADTPPPPPPAARRCRAGSLHRKSVEKGSVSAGSGRILLLRMAQSPPLETHDKDASPPCRARGSFGPAPALKPWKA